MPPKAPPVKSPLPPSKKSPGTSKKGPAKKVVPPEDKIKKHFTSLLAQIEGGHYKNAVRTCDKILRIRPGDVDALEAKIYLLLQSEEYEAALELISTPANAPAKAGGKEKEKEKEGEYEYEKAYSLYRLHREDDALSILSSLKSSLKSESKSSDANEVDRGVLHLDAQVHYRKGEYALALGIYNDLLNSCAPGSDEYNDTLTNLQASQTRVDWLTGGFSGELWRLPIDVLEANPPPAVPSHAHVPLVAASAQKAEPLNLRIPTIAGRPATPQDLKEKEKERETKPQTKKLRASRVPKHVTPNSPPPDPERWLKKSERSTFQSRTRKRGGGGGGGGGATGLGTQGASVGGYVEGAVVGAGGGGKGSGGGKGRGGKRK
ncbi:hypothetical protein SISNIDRAFT_476181 [Sistotremastrum niveocremeum HHB9708]|uniref:Signal recognition particle subunit SRP72 n=1 Tax=Sistotremastrum niveocremeum HHB9708 TaxID=1314777 RepID=A0A164NJD6_9AGAM|nr:hypothetical protein SISNIDRAFT_476181 [Sistotremastrum niveocremeum HHB9708]